jgi:hypothetical protein
MGKIAGSAFALAFLLWGLLSAIGGLVAGRMDWTLIGLVLAGFGTVFLPTVRFLWRGS